MKHFILVAGVDYEFKGVDFRIYCENRMKRIISRNKTNDDLTFKIFDIRRGEIVTSVITYVRGKPITKNSKSTPYKSISSLNYDRSVLNGETHYKFKDGQLNVISILDIYKEVQYIGASAAGTLVELSFFSHAGMGGPILVNSYDDGRIYITNNTTGSSRAIDIPSGARDPDDMDPRAAKDFIYPTMDNVALNSFQKAFHPNGYIWIWGCAFFRLAHEFLYKIENNPSYKDIGLTDDTVFVFKNLNLEYANMLELWISRELGAPFPDKNKIEIKFKFLKYFYSKVTVASYSFQIAKNAKVKTYGGVMGTYSEFDKGNLPLMSVHKGFSRHFTFYKNYLGFSFDPEGRLYGEYNPDFTFSVPTP